MLQITTFCSYEWHHHVKQKPCTKTHHSNYEAMFWMDSSLKAILTQVEITALCAPVNIRRKTLHMTESSISQNRDKYI